MSTGAPAYKGPCRPDAFVSYYLHLFFSLFLPPSLDVTQIQGYRSGSALASPLRYVLWAYTWAHLSYTSYAF